MTVEIRQTERAVLSSWKEIAEYLGKGVRTVQRWEKVFGLPIRRPEHGCKSMVLAFPDDITAWARNLNLAVGGTELTQQGQSALLRQIEELQAENQDLKNQLHRVLVRSA